MERGSGYLWEGDNSHQEQMILDVINESAPNLPAGRQGLQGCRKQLILSSVSACDSRVKKR